MIKIARLNIWPKYFKWEFFSGWIDFETWIKDREYVHDADDCGNSINFYVIVMEGERKFYVSRHGWGWENYGQEDSYLDNQFDIHEVTEVELSKDARENLKFVV